jgi:hypothetical protein
MIMKKGFGGKNPHPTPIQKPAKPKSGGKP